MFIICDCFRHVYLVVFISSCVLGCHVSLLAPCREAREIKRNVISMLHTTAGRHPRVRDLEVKILHKFFGVLSINYVGGR